MVSEKTSYNLCVLQDVAAKYEVRAMPTIMYFKSGQKLDEVVGANPQKIKEVIEKLSN